MITPYTYFNRDISWLSFNERVLEEASKEHVPVMERVRFLSIYSSNLDEFYRVRIPALMALKKKAQDQYDKIAEKDLTETLVTIQKAVQKQQQYFGTIFSQQILPLLAQNNIELIVNK